MEKYCEKCGCRMTIRIIEELISANLKNDFGLHDIDDEHYRRLGIASACGKLWICTNCCYAERMK